MTDQKNLEITLIGISNVGKTTLVDVLNKKEASKEYTSTTEETKIICEFSIKKKNYRVALTDCNGSSFEDNRGTVATIFKKAKIHLFVASVENSESIDYFDGLMKELEHDPQVKPLYRVVVLTHSNESEDEGAVKKCQKIFPANTKIFTYDCFENPTDLLNKFDDFLKTVATEHPELLDGCEIKGKQKTSEVNNGGTTKKPKKEKCILF